MDGSMAQMTPESAEAELGLLDVRAAELRAFLAAYAGVHDQLRRETAARATRYPQCSWCGCDDWDGWRIVNAGLPTGLYLCRRHPRIVMLEDPEVWRAGLDAHSRGIAEANLAWSRANVG